jgi:hypothetical protein
MRECAVDDAGSNFLGNLLESMDNTGIARAFKPSAIACNVVTLLASRLEISEARSEARCWAALC